MKNTETCFRPWIKKKQKTKLQTLISEFWLFSCKSFHFMIWELRDRTRNCNLIFQNCGLKSCHAKKVVMQQRVYNPQIWEIKLPLRDINSMLREKKHRNREKNSIVRKKTQNCEFIFHNSDLITCNCDYFLFSGRNGLP